MSGCENTERMGAYHDGELGSADRAAMERHVGGCTECAAELARVRTLSEMLSGAAQADGEEVSARAMQRFHATADRAGGGPTWRLVRVVLATAAAILIGCGAGLWALGQSRDADEAPPVWELSMMQRPGDAQGAGGEDQTAAWVAQDLAQELAQENGHESK